MLTTNKIPTVFSSLCKTAFIALRNGPFWLVIWCISGPETVNIRVQNGLFHKTVSTVTVRGIVLNRLSEEHQV